MPGPKALRSSLRRLRRTSRSHSRKVLGSANRRKSAARLARIHARVANVRADALHGDIGLSAYAASKGGLLAFGRSLAAEGAGKGVLTNMLLPYAVTQMTSEGISSDDVRRRMTAEAVAPVLTALAAGLWPS